MSGSSDHASANEASRPSTAGSADLSKEVRSAILEIAPDLSPDDLGAERDLHDDLGLDSVDLLNIAKQIAEQTGIEIPESAAAAIRKVGDLIDCVARRRTDSEESDQQEQG